MKRSTAITNSPLIYAGATILTVAAAAGLKWGLDPDSLIRGFFFRCWYIQFANTWLFFLGLLYWIARYSGFTSENKIFRNLVLPDFSIRAGDVKDLLAGIPQEHQYSLGLRRVRALLRAFLYGEDLLRLNEELSRADLANVEKGHLILNSIRNILPIVGFFGTVFGLSLGMMDFPEATSVSALRTALKGFAGSLSLAFDTTLLALAYTVVITLLIAYLRGREETLVGEVDESARVLLDRIKFEESDRGSSVAGDDTFPFRGSELAGEIGAAINDQIQQLVQKLDEIKQDLKRPPRYQVIVQPCEREDNEQP
jgi:biopolymer transport protein ExbB/TolQ